MDRECLFLASRPDSASDWAKTQHNLGVALLRLGKRESDIAGLEEAVAALRDALNEYTRSRMPLDRALAYNSLGSALLALGKDKDIALLEEAVAAYREALKEYTRERAPLDWAMTQNKLRYRKSSRAFASASP